MRPNTEGCSEGSGLKVYSADWVLPVDGAPIENGAVVVEGERIAAVGPAPQFAGEREHFPGAVIAPGFVNAASHLEYAAYSGFGDGLPFGPWMGLHVERKRRLDWESTLALARLGAAEAWPAARRRWLTRASQAPAQSLQTRSGFGP